MDLKDTAIRTEKLISDLPVKATAVTSVNNTILVAGKPDTLLVYTADKGEIAFDAFYPSSWRSVDAEGIGRVRLDTYNNYFGSKASADTMIVDASYQLLIAVSKAGIHVGAIPSSAQKPVCMKVMTADNPRTA